MEKSNLLHDGAQISVVCRSLIANSPALKGKMLNCSCKGICIELNQRIEEGSIVMLKANLQNPEDNSTPLPEGFRSFSLAEVKWFKPLEDKALHHYAIGLRYLTN
jgi:hypothetical protein